MKFLDRRPSLYSPSYRSSKSLSIFTMPVTCACKHDGEDHVFIRCGCPNDYPKSHPMHVNDDAFHHVWCIKCLKFCYKISSCPVPLRNMQVAYLTKVWVKDRCVFLRTVGYTPDLLLSVISCKFTTHSKANIIASIKTWMRKRNPRSSILRPKI